MGCASLEPKEDPKLQLYITSPRGLRHSVLNATTDAGRPKTHRSAAKEAEQLKACRFLPALLCLHLTEASGKNKCLAFYMSGWKMIPEVKLTSTQQSSTDEFSAQAVRYFLSRLGYLISSDRQNATGNTSCHFHPSRSSGQLFRSCRIAARRGPGFLEPKRIGSCFLRAAF